MKQKKDKTTTHKEKEPRFYNSKVNRMYLLTLSKLPSDQNSCTEAFSVEHELEESEGVRGTGTWGSVCRVRPQTLRSSASGSSFVDLVWKGGELRQTSPPAIGWFSSLLWLPKGKKCLFKQQLFHKS